MIKFDSFYIDSTKRQEVKIKFDKILESIEHKMWWFKHCNVDDFEVNNVVNEIDSHYRFEKINDILAKRDKR